MPNIELLSSPGAVNPLDVVERVIEVNDWSFDRRSDLEMVVQVPGAWCDYSLYFAWNEDIDAIHFTCAFDIRVPAKRRAAIFELLTLINEKLWIGHFGMWLEEGQPLYRHTLPLRGTKMPAAEQFEDLVEAALGECERFYPAFQYVIWGGKDPEDAIAAAMVDTVGEA